MDDICKVLKPNMFMASVDIASAYRSVSVRADHWGYQGISWNFGDGDNYYVDTRLCFGLRCAPFIFSCLSSYVVKIMRGKGFANIFCYLDDYLILGDTWKSCQEAQIVLIRVLIELGFYINWKKCTSPSQVCTYLGIVIDSVDMELSLPEKKLKKFKLEMEFFAGRDRATKRQLQKLFGILNHCSKLVKGGRTFTHRIIELLKGLPEKNVRIRLSKGFKQDLLWWRKFSQYFNGVSSIIGVEPDEYVYTDSSLLGYGLCWRNDWMAGYYNTEQLPYDLDQCDEGHCHWANLSISSPHSRNI